MQRAQSAEEARSLLRPVETQRASEAIYEQIKELIIEGQFKPGDRLPSERSLMEMLQRSRPTIREALRMLERSGFIRTAPGTNGAIVQEMDTSGVEQSLEVMLRTSVVSLEELAEYRSHNDVAVAVWAARRHTEEDLLALEEILKDAARLVETEEYAAFIQADCSFHSALARAGKNKVADILSRVLSSLVETKLGQVLRRQTEEERRNMCCRILAQHRQVFEAVRAGDAVSAESAMQEHIHAFMDDLGEQEGSEAAND